ncbi:MAG: acyl-CoA thioesterase [Acidobacteria bacterium]|nr:acyl-CoA thioesterase [Acidobacteriota bacterium]
MENRHAMLAGFPVVVEVPVQFGDQDAFGHVNNIVYLRWCETARVEYLIRIGMWPKLPPGGEGPILAGITCNFRRPVTYPDTIYAGARVTRIGKSSFRMEHRIVSREMDLLAAEADSTLVYLDYSRDRTVPVPEANRKAIEALEGRVF